MHACTQITCTQTNSPCHRKFAPRVAHEGRSGTRSEKTNPARKRQTGESAEFCPIKSSYKSCNTQQGSKAARACAEPLHPLIAAPGDTRLQLTQSAARKSFQGTMSQVIQGPLTTPCCNAPTSPPISLNHRPPMPSFSALSWRRRPPPRVPTARQGRVPDVLQELRRCPL